LRTANPKKAPFLIKDNSKTLRLRGQRNSKILLLRAAKKSWEFKIFL
jgi:hypothetical protein